MDASPRRLTGGIDASPRRLTEGVDTSREECPARPWMPAFAGMTVGCGGLHEGVDGRVWMASPRRLTAGCGCLPRGVPRQTLDARLRGHDGRLWRPPRRGGRQGVASRDECPPPRQTLDARLRGHDGSAVVASPRRWTARVWMPPETSAPPDPWMPAFAGMTVVSRASFRGMTAGCGGLPEGVDGRVWMPPRRSRRVWMTPERSAPPDTWMPASGDLCTTVVPAQAGIQGGGERDGFPSSRERRKDGQAVRLT